MARVPQRRFYLKKRDTLPVLVVTCRDEDGDAYDFSDATAAYLHVLLSTGAVVTFEMTFVTPKTSGQLTYTWAAGDWDDLIAGTHKMEYEVVGAGGARQTFPNDGYDYLVVADDIAQGS